jgi:uncharacterized integral membrane protein (TIGR00697 family)
LLLAGFFIANALMAETIGGKLFQFGPFTLSLGVIAWPFVFVISDLVNEFFGRDGVKRLTFVTAGLILYAFFLTIGGMAIPAVSYSPVSDSAFNMVFGQSSWIMIASLIAFMASQFIDVAVFWAVRHYTKGKWLWARSTGSTLVSQLVDTFIVMGIAFWLPGKVTFAQYLAIASSNYAYKFLVACAMTPAIYAGHSAIDRFIGEGDAHRMIESAAHREEVH